MKDVINTVRVNFTAIGGYILVLGDLMDNLFISGLCSYRLYHWSYGSSP